jgi:3'5'-cyclic nucleotide phosphodiesterase
MMTTYWCDPKIGSGSVKSGVGSTSDSSNPEVNFEQHGESATEAAAKHQRLVDWNVDLFTKLLQKVSSRRSSNAQSSEYEPLQSPDTTTVSVGYPVDEVTEAIDLPTCCPFPLVSPATSTPAVVSEQLREFILSIATVYRDNAFHNFDHASHVVMNTIKLIRRITERETEAKELPDMKSCSGEVTLDPLSQLALLFGALIHDVDHPGVSNGQLVKEDHALAISYNGKCVAEQNSVDIAWKLLMEPRFTDLRAAMFCTEEERRQFRQVMVNVVMATDLFDKDLKALREARWEKSFCGDGASESSAHAGDALTDVIRGSRAAIILDLIIQASDVSHTMQHFTVYQKWNMCLLTEMFDAYQSGRTSTDPSEGWYEGELWFFDNYVIPLATKLRQCKEFGVSCDEFLDYAKDNRMEWEMKGRDIVNAAMEALRSR